MARLRTAESLARAIINIFTSEQYLYSPVYRVIATFVQNIIIPVTFQIRKMTYSLSLLPFYRTFFELFCRKLAFVLKLVGEHITFSLEF